MAEQGGARLADETPTMPEDLYADLFRFNKPGGGPKTPGGKERSSVNATKHGSCSNRLIIKGESESDYNAQEEALLDDYQPTTRTGVQQVRSLARAQWFLWRTERNLNDVYAVVGEKTAIEWSEEDHKQIDRFSRYKTTAERSYERLWRRLDTMRKDRAREMDAQWKREQEELKQQWKREEKREKKEQAEGQKAAEKIVRKEKKEEKVETEDKKPKRTPAQALFKGQRHVKKRGVVNNLTQWIEVTVEEGKTVTSIYPKTAEELIKTGQGMWPPPTLVYRRFNFVGCVPPEYHWATGDQVRRERGGSGIQRMTADAWLEQIKIEEELGVEHLGPIKPGNLPRPTQRGGCECPVCTANQELLERWEKGDMLLPVSAGQEPCAASEGVSEEEDGAEEEER